MDHLCSPSDSNYQPHCKQNKSVALTTNSFGSFTMTYEEIVKINGMEKFAKPVYPCCIARAAQLLGGAGWTIDHWLSNQTFLFHQLFLRPLFRKIYWVFEEYDWHGGGRVAFQIWKHILTYVLRVMAWTCTNNLRVVLSPCAQYWPCEASEQKMGHKLKS